MKIKHKLAVVALATGIAGGVMAAPAFGAADFNGNGANCRGVEISQGNAITDSSIAQFAKLIGVSVKTLQGVITESCSV